MDIDKPKAIIFDLDGTLYPMKWMKWKMVWENKKYLKFLYSLHPTRNEIRDQDLGDRNSFYRTYFNLFAAKVHTKADVIEDWYFSHYYPNFIKILKSYSHRPHLLETLKNLKAAGVKLGLLSEYAVIDERLTALGIDPSYFSSRMSCEEVGALKPHPKAFYRISENLDVPPNDCWVVGDRQDTDGDGASQSGMKAMILDQDELSWQKLIYTFEPFY